MELEPPGTPPFVRIDHPQDVPQALVALGVRCGRPVVVVVGGAGGMSEADQARMDEIITDWLVPLVERHGAAMVDGGTDAGVMRMAGRARRRAGAGFPLIGVAALETVRLPGRAPGLGDQAADLEPHHTGVIVVPGATWGRESPWIPTVVDHLAGAAASVTLVINGGPITLDDVEHSLAGQRPVIVIDGSGRTADAIAQAVTENGPRSADPQLAGIASSHLVRVITLNEPAAVAAAVETALAGPPEPA